MADMEKPEHPMEVLPAMLNLVLLQTAKIFRDPECRNLKQAGLTKRRVTEMVTTANQRFHDALDEIELEILQAKAVMERDLRLVRKKRAESDRAKGLVISPSPPKEAEKTASSNAIDEVDSTMIDAVEEGSGDIQPATEAAKESLDEVSKDARSLAAETLGHEGLNTEQAMPPDAPKTMDLPLAVTSEDATAVSEDSKIPTKAIAEVTQTEAPVEIPDAVDLDFESMFNDTDPKAIDDALNFDFGISTEPAVAQDILNDGNFNDIDMGNADITNLPTTNDDIDSLLPGVENYLNEGADFSNMTIPMPTTLPDSAQGPTTSTTAPPDAGTTEAAIAETSFDDNFFGLGNFDMGDAGGDDLGDATLGDFEDFDWKS